MVKSFMTLVVLVLSVAGAQAQDLLQVQGTAPDLYIAHTVKKGETFYSLGRAYSLSPKDIAAENSITLDKGLQLGQTVKIPLNNNNFSQKADAANGNTPLYHKVEEKETLYRLSLNHNKVPRDNIRHWNNFSGDGLKKDSYVIVGYLKGGGIPASAPVASTPAPAPVNNTPTQPAAAPPANNTPVIAPPVNNTPASAPEAAATTPPPASTPAKTVVSSGGTFEQIFNQQTGNGKNVTTE